jgi:two-component system chemotaxis family response regulator WspR
MTAAFCLENSRMTEATALTAGHQAVTEFKVRVLLVDDQLIIVEAIRRMLAEHADIAFHYVTDPAAAVATAHQLQPTVILQDLAMPGVDGFGLIRAYRDDPRLGPVPVIVLSAKDDPQLKARSFAVGANDYVVKLPDRLELLARIRYYSAGYIARLQRDEALRGQRDKKPLSLLMCDSDCFKACNDSFGHLAGDLCLKKPPRC